nr:helical backbone metal receptor [uncultured Bacillus sp.]
MLKKSYSFLLVLLLAIFVAVGCGTTDKKETNEANKETKTEQTENGAFPVTIKDTAKHDVVIEKKPERIVSLMPSNTEISFALGLGDEIIGVTDNDNYPKEVEKKEKIGGMDFNIEKIISLKPDLVLGYGGTSMGSSEEGLQQLRDAGITVLVVNDATSFADVYGAINMIGKATGTQKEAKKLVTDMKATVEEIKEKAAGIKEEDKKQVYIEIYPGPGGINSAGSNTFMDEMLDMIHAENVVTEEGWPTISEEAIIAANPDVILTTYGYYTEDPMKVVSSREGWQDMDAVKNKRIVDVDSDTVTRSGPRLVEGVEEVAKAVYPEVFK